MAATTTSYPCVRAASSTRKGNLPLPAIRPRRVISTYHVAADECVHPAEQSFAGRFDRTVPRVPRSPHPDGRMRPSLREQRCCSLLNHPAFGRFTKADDHLNIFATIDFCFKLLYRLRSIQFRRQHHPIRVMNFPNAPLGESP